MPVACGRCVHCAMWSSEYVWPLCTSGKGTTWEMPICHEANPTNYPKDTNVELPAHNHINSDHFDYKILDKITSQNKRQS